MVLVSTCWKLVSSILGLGSMGNVCYIAISNCLQWVNVLWIFTQWSWFTPHLMVLQGSGDPLHLCQRPEQAGWNHQLPGRESRGHADQRSPAAGALPAPRRHHRHGQRPCGGGLWEQVRGHLPYFVFLWWSLVRFRSSVWSLFGKTFGVGANRPGWGWGQIPTGYSVKKKINGHLCDMQHQIQLIWGKWKLCVYKQREI